MGFWSTLGNVAGGFFGDPGLGDQLGGLFGAGQDVGQVAGNAAAGAAAGRLAQGNAQQGQDRNAIALYQAKNAAAQQALNQNSQLAHQSAQGDLMSNVQDVNITGLPPGVHMANLTGGLRPSDLGPNARQAGQTLSRNALMQLMAGPTNLPQAPNLTPLPQASGFDQVNAGLGYGGAMLGAISPLFRQQPMQQGPGFVNGATFPNGIPGGDVNPEDAANAWPLNGSLFGGG